MSGIIKPYTIRQIKPGPIVVPCTRGAWPVTVRDDRGELTIYMLESIDSPPFAAREPATIKLYLVLTGEPIEGHFDAQEWVGSASISGEVWHVFEGEPTV